MLKTKWLHPVVLKRYQLSEERIYGHDDEIPKDKVVVHSYENLQLSVYGEHNNSWTKYEYDHYSRSRCSRYI